MSKKLRLVPKSATRTDIERLAARLGWTRTQEPSQMSWRSADGGATISWIEDQQINVDYLLLEGPANDPTLDELSSALEFHSTPSLHALFDSTRNGRAVMHALHVLGVHCSGPYDPELFALFRWALHDPDPRVRRDALRMVPLTDWAEFLPLIDYLRTHDPEESVRSEAATIFGVLSARLGITPPA